MSETPVTDSEAKQELLTLLPLSDEQLAAAVSLSPNELAELIRGMQLASEPEKRSALRAALDFIHTYESDLLWLGPIGEVIKAGIDLAEGITS